MKKMKRLLFLLIVILFIPIIVSAKSNDYIVDMLSSNNIYDITDSPLPFMVLQDKGIINFDDELNCFYDENDLELFRINQNGEVVMNDSLTTDNNIIYKFTNEDKTNYNIEFDRMISILSDKSPEKNNEVYISEVKLDDQSDNVIINKRALPNGLNIDVDIRFKNVGDYAKYKVKVKNNTNKDYQIDDQTRFGDSDYIKYEFSFDDKNNEIKAGQEKTMYVKISYNKEIPEEALENGRYTESRSMDIELIDSASIVNPKTGRTIISILVLLISSGLVIYLIRNRKSRKLMAVVMVLGLLVPSIVLAAEKLTITINSNIEVAVKPQICVYNSGGIKSYYQYDDGMTVREFLDSNYNVDEYSILSEFKYNSIDSACHVPKSPIKSTFNSSIEENLNMIGLGSVCNMWNYVNESDEIISEDEGCYYINDYED